VGWLVVGLLFNAVASFDPPGWSLFFLVPVVLVVFAGIILACCVGFMRLYYRLGLPQQFGNTAN